MDELEQCALGNAIYALDRIAVGFPLPDDGLDRVSLAMTESCVKRLEPTWPGHFTNDGAMWAPERFDRPCKVLVGG